MTRREHHGALCWPEQYCIKTLVGLIPWYVAPNHLTVVAFGGALVGGMALVGCRLSTWFLLPFYLGLVANWFGDSFDGALARHRRCERHRVGFLIDRSSDILSFCVIISALGLSPYLSVRAALMLLVAYLVHAAYGLMRMVVDGTQIIGFGKIGATEGRIFIGLWVGVFQVTQIDLASIQIGGIGVFDALCAGLLVVHLAIFVRRISFDIDRIADQEHSIVSLRHADPSDDNVFFIREMRKMHSLPGKDSAMDGA